MGRPRSGETDLPANVHRKGRHYYFVVLNKGARLWLRLGNEADAAFAKAELLRSAYLAVRPIDRGGDLKDAAQRRDGFTCRYCGATRDLELDHVVPLSRGGANTLRNVVLACRSCNASKSAQHPSAFLRKHL